jgi:hypothetical protein
MDIEKKGEAMGITFNMEYPGRMKTCLVKDL